MTDRVTMIRERLTQALAPDQIDVQDDSAQHAGHAGAQSGGGHYTVVIVSSRFTGKSLVERHRMIYDALGEAMRHDIHALVIRAKTPGET